MWRRRIPAHLEVQAINAARTRIGGVFGVLSKQPQAHPAEPSTQVLFQGNRMKLMSSREAEHDRDQRWRR